MGEAQELWTDAQDGIGVASVERRTLEHVLKEFKITDKAANFLKDKLKVQKSSGNSIERSSSMSPALGSTPAPAEQEALPGERTLTILADDKVVKEKQVEDLVNDETEDDVEDDEEEINFDMLAESAVLAAGLKPRRDDSKDARAPKELSIDAGISEERLYIRPNMGGDSKAFNAAAAPGVNRLRFEDYAEGVLPEVSSIASAEVRQIRGAKVRPIDDAKLLRKEARAQKEEKLEKWFGLRKQQLTPQLEKELKAIKLRANVDPKRFYKGNDSKELPKYFAVATELPGGMRAAGLRPSQDPKPGRGRSFLDTIMRDERVHEWTGKRQREVADRGHASAHSGHGKRGSKSSKRGGAWKKQKRR